MKTTKFIIILSFLFANSLFVNAQKSEYIPNLSKVNIAPNWQVLNRVATYDDHLYLNGQPGDGMVYLNDFVFINGTIELDIKGKNDPGRSFLGVAFHILNDSVFDAIYFRPFNFQNPDRNNHSIQYISMPDYNWYNLRETYPGKYENMISSTPNPEEWVHVKIEIEHPKVKVYVNGAKKPSLIVDQISKRGEGMLGLWVGNNSKGSFKNLKISFKF